MNINAQSSNAPGYLRSMRTRVSVASLMRLDDRQMVRLDQRLNRLAAARFISTEYALAIKDVIRVCDAERRSTRRGAREV